MGLWGNLRRTWKQVWRFAGREWAARELAEGFAGFLRRRYPSMSLLDAESREEDLALFLEEKMPK